MPSNHRMTTESDYGICVFRIVNPPKKTTWLVQNKPRCRSLKLKLKWKDKEIIYETIIVPNGIPANRAKVENPIERKTKAESGVPSLYKLAGLPQRYFEHYLCAASHIARFHKSPDQFA